MIYYDNKTLAKMKTAELEDLIKLFVDGGVEAPEKFANNAERIAFIEASTVEKGYPYRITEEWLKANAESVNPQDIGDLEVGAVIFVPAPTEEDSLREELLQEAGAMLSGLDEEARMAILTEMAQLSIEDLTAKVQTMKDEEAAAKDHSGSGDENKPEDEEAPEKPEMTQPAPVQTSTGDVIADAIATGHFKYENTTIIAYSVNVFAGQTRYELHGADRATYTATKEEVEKIVNSILK